MPISPITLQRRHAELGRIRLGRKVGGNGRPEKLGAFRFTSASERYIADLAELYGGTPQPWDNNGKPEFEVFSTATTMPVIVVKGGLSQWMETWSGGGVAHRCDGEQQVDGTYCDPDDPKHQAAKPTTRLSVMLPELEALGVWRMESHGWNAAAEIPAVAELAQYVGDLVPAHLNLMERRAVKDGKTSRFVVPVLDLQIGTARLRQLVAEKSGMAELEVAPGPAAIDSPSSAPTGEWTGYHARLEAAASLDDLTTLWSELVHAELVGQAAAEEGRVTAEAAAFTEAFRARAATLKNGRGATNEEGAAVPESPAPSSPQPDADGVVDAELVDEPDPDQVWAQIVQAAAAHGLTRLPDLEEDVTVFLGGTSSAEASGAELTEYLEDLVKRPIEQAS